MMNTMTKSYSELIQFSTFKERYEYLKLDGQVGIDTFGFDRYLNQTFYRSPEWRQLRDRIVIRDNGCDLGIEGFELHGPILIHHINPITQVDIIKRSDILMNPENLICVSHRTHNAIHYGDDGSIPRGPVERRPGDTIPWKKG